MFDLDRWREIFQTINKNKLRTFLAGFTVALGIFIFTVLFGMGNGLKNTFHDFFNDDAQNTLFIYPGRTSKPYNGFKENRRIEFKNEDLNLLRETFKDRIEYSTVRIYRGVNAKYKNEFGSYTLRAVHPEHQYLEKTIMDKGRYITDRDIQEKSRIVVIGRLVESDLFGKENSLGKNIIMNDLVYRVVGVFSDEGGDREERYIYTPATTTQLIYKNTDVIDQVNLSYHMELGANGARSLSRDIKKLLKKKHNISPKDRQGIYVQNVIEDLERNLQVASVLQWVVFFIGIGTLIAGAIGISNIMVYVVKERTKELGIRKALGAKPGSIISLILQETVVVTIIFGYLGLMIGNFVLKSMGNKLEDWFITNPNVDTSTVVIATIILVLAGAFAGYIPARRAARIKPIVALRDE